MTFHNVLRVFHDVLLVVHNVLLVHILQVVHDVLKVFQDVLQVFQDVLQVFNNVLWCLVSHAMIGIDASVIASEIAATPQGLRKRSRDRENGGGISDNCRNRRWHRRARRYHSESDPMLNSVLNGNRSNSVPGRQYPKGISDRKLFIFQHCWTAAAHKLAPKRINV